MKLSTLIQRALPALLVMFALAAAPPDMRSETKDKKNKSGKTTSEKGEKGSGASKILRVPNNPFESIKNKVSNVEFFSTNYGIFGLNVATGDAGGFWPRGSANAYIFGGGVWFGAKKFVTVSGLTQLKSLSVIGYDPNSGASWMTPGRIQGDPTNSPIDNSPEGISKYRLYFSTDYNNFTGEPLDAADRRANGPNWPIWDTNPGDTLKFSRYFGSYLDDVTQRNRESMPDGKGPAMISQEDIFSTYKDTDVSRYNGEEEAGLPFGIQVEQTIYSWGFGSDASPYRDFVFLRYQIINMSDDTLRDAYMAPAMDMDLGQAANDHTRFYSEGDSLNLGVQWSEGSSGDGAKFGYIGFDFLESPAVDTNITSPNFGFIRKDKRVYTTQEQIGLTTFQNWVIDDDPKSPAERYQFMAANEKDGDNGAGDKRFLMATGPFSMLPGDTARVVVGVLFARTAGEGVEPGAGGIATGTELDLRRLVGVDTFAQQVYDKNFLAPVPPDAAFLSWRPLDNGVELHWDSTSEISFDQVERGLDFAGYRIQRTRKASGKFTPDPNDSIQGWNIGWKTIGGFALPPLPDSLTRFIAARRGDPSMLGAWYRLPMLLDTGSPGIAGTQFVYRADTLKRTGLPDSIRIRTDLAPIDTLVFFNFTFDPYDDVSRDSNTYAERVGRRAAIRDIVRDAITDIMDSITNGRRFIDVGDDNRNGVILENSSNLALNEKLINNVDYYYRLLAYDAGSVEEGTPSKENSSVEGINEIRARPEAPAAGFPVTPTIISQDGLIGVSNPRFLVMDDERLGQLFGGDEITFEFQPTDANYLLGLGYLNYFYTQQMVVRSKKQGELMRYIIPFDIAGASRFSDRQELLDTALRSGMRYYNFRDTLTFRDTVDEFGNPITIPVTLSLRDSIFLSMKERSVLYSGSFMPTPGTLTIYGQTPIYKNTFALAFDYTFRQFGDSLRFGRGDSLSRLAPFTVTNGAANTTLFPKSQFLGQIQGTIPYQPIPSLGQAKIEVEFVDCPGCTEDISFTKGAKTYTFRGVPYMTLKVRNVAEFTRDVISETGATESLTTPYNFEFTPDPLADFRGDTARLSAPNLVRQIPLGQFGLFAYGFINPESASASDRRSAIRRSNYMAQSPVVRPIGTANRYYIGQVTGTDETGAPVTMRFNHKLLVNGAEISIDFSGFTIEESNPGAARNFIPDNLPAQDFAPGNKFVADFTGGTLGLPQPGAKVVVSIPETKPKLDQYTDDLLDQIRVVPNPFLISHVGMRANSEKMLYFTRLPEQCTIQIYTGTGELLQTIEHKASDVDRVAVNAWELLTKGNRQVQSQLLVARITTPNGSETVKKFAVVVGGFRVVE